MIKFFKNIKKPLLALGTIHLFLGFFHLMFFDLGHPINQYIQNLPVFLQVISASVYALVMYLISGYLLMIALNKNSDQMLGIGKALIVALVVFIAVFMGLYFAFLMNGRQSIWLAYSFFNPLFGTVMYNRMPETIMGLLWSVSIVIPGIGMLTGMYLAVKQGGFKQ